MRSIHFQTDMLLNVLFSKLYLYLGRNNSLLLREQKTRYINRACNVIYSPLLHIEHVCTNFCEFKQYFKTQFASNLLH